MKTGFVIFSQSYCNKLKKIVNTDPTVCEDYKDPGKSFLSTEKDDFVSLDTLNVDETKLAEINEKTLTNFEVAKRLYEAFPNLLPIMAAHAPFWVRLSHVELLPFMQKRYPDPSKKTIQEYWFQHGATTSFLSGMWWAVYMTVDEDRADKYELTKVIFRTQDLRIKTLGTYKIFRHKPASTAILEFIMNHEDLFKNHFEKKERYFTKYLNNVGGRCQMAAMDKQFFTDLLIEQIPQIATQK